MAAMVLPTRMCIIMVKKVAAGRVPARGSSESKLYVGCIVLFVLEPTWELIRDQKKKDRVWFVIPLVLLKLVKLTNEIKMCGVRAQRAHLFQKMCTILATVDRR